MAFVCGKDLLMEFSVTFHPEVHENGGQESVGKHMEEAALVTAQSSTLVDLWLALPLQKPPASGKVFHSLDLCFLICKVH